MSGRSYRSIGEVLTQLRTEFPDVTISKIRFLEAQGLVAPQRSPSGYRKFSATDVERLLFVLRQQREHFLPLKVIKARVEETFGAAPTPAPAATPSPNPADRAAKLERMASVVAALQEGPRGAPAPLASSGESDAEEVTAMADQPMENVAAATGSTLDAVGLAAACGLSAGDLAQAEACGLLRSHTIAGEVVYRDDAVAVAKVLGQFAKFGIEPRHLRTHLNAVDREIGLIGQAVAPLLRTKTPEARQRAAEQASEMARLGQSLRASLLRRALGELLGN